MTDIGILYKQKVFSLEYVAEMLSISRPAASKAMLRWQERGIVRQIRKNMYTAIDLATGSPVADRFEVASRISATSFVGWHSALEFHGLAHQQFFDMYVGSESRFTHFEFEGVSFAYCASSLLGEDSGVCSAQGNPHVRVTDLERTLVDCIDHIDRAGGPEELMHCMEGVLRVDEERMAHYLRLYGKDFLYQKAGYMLDRIKGQAAITDDLISLCHSRGTRYAKRLTNGPDSNRYVSEWKLYVPDFMTTVDIDDHDLI